MAKTVNTTIKFTGQFDTSQITKGLQDIKKQMSNSHIGEDLRKQLETALNKVEANIPALEKMSAKGEFNIKELQQYQKLIVEIQKDMNKFSDIIDNVDFKDFISQEDSNKLKLFDSQIQKVEDRINSLRKEMIDAFSQKSGISIQGDTMQKAIEELFSVDPDQVKNKFDEIKNEVVQQSEKAQEDVQNALLSRSKKFEKNKDVIDFLYGENSKVTINRNFGGPAVQALQQAKLAIQDLAAGKEVVDFSEKLQRLFELISQTGEFEGAFKNPDGEESAFNKLKVDVTESTSQLEKLEPHLDKIAEISREKLDFINEAEAEKMGLVAEKANFLNEVLNLLVKTQVLTKNQAKALADELVKQGEAAAEGAEQLRNEKIQADALAATFGTLANRITNSISALTIFNKSIQIVHKAINSVKELDAAFTQIAIVSEQTNEQAWEMFDSFNKLAKQYSITTKDLAEGAKLFYQQGLSAADTMKMVEASTISAALGEVTMTEAANTLTAAIQGYNESAAVAMDYTDKIAMVGAVSAADFNELSAAMEKTASSAYTAGIDFDHLLGYLGKMIEVTREAPANLGTAMKTIIARFEDMKKDPMAILEDGVSANKVETALATIGVALRDTAGEFRPLQDVFLDLGMKWDSLTRNQQAYIATVAAGSRQQSRFLALFNNFDRTLDLITESQNSAGAAAEQYATYQDSAAAATARLTAAWEEFYSKITNSQMIVTVINSLTKLVEIMSKIGPTWSAAIATIGAHSINKIIKSNVLSSLFSQVIKSGEKDITVTFGSALFSGIKEGFKSAKGEVINSGIQEALANSANQGIKTGIMSGLASAGASIGGTFVSVLGAIAPVLAVITGIIIAITTIQAIQKDINKKNEEYLKTQSEKIKKIKEGLEDFKKEKQTIEDNYEIYKKYENRLVLTNEELEEQNNAVDAIKEQYKDLVVITDELGRKNIVNTQQLEKHTEFLDKEIKDEKELIALGKLRAIQPTYVSKDMYGNNNKQYMKDWTSEQLMNVGFSQEDAEILDLYGEFQRTGGQDNVYERLAKDLEKRGFKQNRSLSHGKYWSELNYLLQLDDENLENFSNDITALLPKDKNLDDLDNESKAMLEILQGYASTMIRGKEILENSTKEYANSIAMANLDIEDAVLNSDISNILNNMTQYNEDYFDTKNKKDDRQIKKDVEKEIEDINDAINDKLKESDRKPLHDFLIKLQDPTLSQTERNEIISKAEEEFDYLDGALDGIIEAHRYGTKQEREQRNKLAEAFGVETTVLDSYNFQQMNLLDKLFTNSTLQEDEKKVQFSRMITDPATKIYLDALDDFKKNVAEDPEIYKPVHDAVIKMWQESLGLDKKDATELFESTYGTLSEIALSAARENFDKAKANFDMGPTDSLSDEQYTELEKTLGNSLRYYIDINEEGEKYLTLAGRLAILDKERLKYEKTILAQIQDNKQKIDEINEAEGLTKKEQEKQINNYKKENELLGKQLKQLQEVKRYSSISNAMSTNISYADSYYDSIDAIKAAEEEAKKSNGRISRSTAETLKSMNAEYALYLNLRESGEGAYYELTADNAQKMRKIAIDDYNKQLEIERQKLDDKITLLKGELQIFQDVVDGKSDLSYQEYQNEVKNLDKILEGNVEEKNDELITEENQYDKSLTMASTYASEYEKTIGTALDNLGVKANDLHNAMATAAATDREFDPYGDAEQKNNYTPNKPKRNGELKAEKQSPTGDGGEKARKAREAEQAAMKADAQIQIDRINREIEILESTKNQLKPLAPDLEDLSKSGGKADESMQKLTDTLEDLADALKDLDDLLKEVKKELKDIDVDYNPFTDLFEAWEHEWDYYYNIKRLLQQIDTQGQYIDNIISADYISADKRIEAEHAKVGNLLAKMSANDTYIEALRAGMSQTAVELMKDYGEYYKVDPTTGQLYQTDKNLNDINELMNERKQEIYDLQKLQNEKENDLNLENAKLEALEQEKSAYEDILSTIESQYDSLKDNEDITVDISGLEKEKTELEAKINITDESIEAQKDKIRKMEDDIQDIEVGLTLKDQDFQKLEDYVSDMEDKVSEYEEYWENLNSTIAEQQELLSNLNELYKGYVDTAISTQQELYDAIVENYQDEINQKKKQYDYLKQLDNDYLQSVKDNVNKERQAREDANKQKSYQQNVQRAQLLQMDTSGAYRNELANLNKEIENQRQDLYDDLVDKQVEALEKEIDKRHELYDKEVAALEERLAYYQENAILLWEMVNSIVAEGANAMMATLENTMAYINSNELTKDQQRKTWEYNVKKTFDGVQNHTIDTLNNLIQAGNDFVINKYPEIGTALDDYKQVFAEASDVINEYNSQLIFSRDTLNNDTERATQVFQGILDSFMTIWNDRTNEFTGYAQNWVDVTNSLKQQTENNLSDLRDLYDEQGKAIESAIGSIEDYDQSLRDASAEIYQDFLDERRSYREELETLINQIQDDISAAIGDAAGEIRSAANNISYNPTPNSSTNSGNNGITTPSTGSSGYNNIEEPDQYKITGQYRYIEENGQNRTATKTLDGFDSREEAIEALYAYLRGASKGFRWRSYNLESYGVSAYAQGGLASFTGPAWLDGTKSNPERVLSPKQTKLFESMISSLERTANNSNINSPFNSSYNIGDINTTIQVEKLDNETDIEKVARQVENRIMKTIRNRVSISVA